MTDFESRIEALELAVLVLANQEFGDHPGHLFHGNQWGVPEGVDVVVRREDSEHSTVVLDHKTVLGRITRVGHFIGHDSDDPPFEAKAAGGKLKEFKSADEAVRHILKAKAVV